MNKLSPTTIMVIKAFIPYTKENLMLSFQPNIFFNELEKTSKTKKSTLRSSYYRSIKNGLIGFDKNKIPKLTSYGEKLLLVSEAKKLKSGYLIVVFDIPENKRYLRRHIRALLIELKFQMVQRSVWVSRYDFEELLKKECVENKTDRYVKIFKGEEVNLRR